jgi:pyruvate ferredoxin oxidoreductase delta subunit
MPPNNSTQTGEPASAIPVKDGKRLDFDMDHCKGCGICVKACPFKAIEFIKE